MPSRLRTSPHWLEATLTYADALSTAQHSSHPLQAPLADAEGEAGRERRFVHALLLAWFASQNRSLFAARCLVEVVVEMYREGVTVDDVAVRGGGGRTRLCVGRLRGAAGGHPTAHRSRRCSGFAGALQVGTTNGLILTVRHACELRPPSLSVVRHAHAAAQCVAVVMSCRSCCLLPACSRAAGCWSRWLRWAALLLACFARSITAGLLLTPALPAGMRVKRRFCSPLARSASPSCSLITCAHHL